MTVNVAILICWTLVDPLRWFRKAVSFDPYGRTTASIGFCKSNNPVPFLAALVTVNACVIAVASYQSYVARKISTEFSESDYIAKCVMLVLIVSFMSGPMFLFADQNPKSYFFMVTSSVFCVSLSLLLLIFLPKVFYRGDGLQAAVRRSIVHNNSLQIDYTNGSWGDCDEIGTAILDHPKLNSVLAERLKCAELEIRRLKGVSHCINEGPHGAIAPPESSTDDPEKNS